MARFLYNVQATVVVFIADVHWGFLVIVGVDGVVAAVFVLTLGFFVQSR